MIVPREAIEKAVEAILKEDRDWCECRRSPFDKHDVNPPCKTRKQVTRQVEMTLDIIEPYIQPE